MALDKNNDNIIYLLGRVFAVLRQAELRMKNSKKGPSIVDRKMSEIYQHPAFWFSRFHVQFLSGFDNYLNDEMAEIMEKIPSTGFAERVCLRSQSTFLIGFNHEKTDLEQVYDVIDGIV